mgnify:CR=1 FL=1
MTKASGLRVPVAVGDFMILDAIRESNGRALSVDETRISDWTRQACSKEGISLCPEAGACVGALQQLREEKWIDENEKLNKLFDLHEKIGTNEITKKQADELFRKL